MSFIKTSNTSKDLNIAKKVIDKASKKGYLYKQGGSNKGWKKRWIVLKWDEIYYFETDAEDKVVGKFNIEGDWNVYEANESKLKRDFCIMITGNSLKQPRFLSAENDASRKEWIQILKETITQCSKGAYDRLHGTLLKPGPNPASAWKKRFCMLKEKDFLYYKQTKDILPAGVISLEDCSRVDLALDQRPFCFMLQQEGEKPRAFYFAAESQPELEKWVDAIKAVANFRENVGRRSSANVPRELFLGKPIKEGILNKMKKRGQISKTKPIRLVLSPNFLYYFPTPNSTDKYHSIHLHDCLIETVPSSIERLAFSFRIVNLLHPLYVGAEIQKEYDVWLSTISTVKERLQLSTESKTEADIKRTNNVDYTIEVVSEKSVSNVENLSMSKVYDVRVNAFWTTFTLQKTYQDFYQLYLKLLQQFPEYIFPEVPEEPLYIQTLAPELKDKRKMRRGSLNAARKGGMIDRTIASLRGNLPEAFDDQHDLKFIKCLARELLLNRKVSQHPEVLSFFQLNDMFAAISSGEIAFVRHFLDQKPNLNFLNEQGIAPLHIAVQKGFRQIAEALVKDGANPNFPNKKGTTAVHLAAEAGDKEMLSLLLDSGGELKYEASGQTLLHTAAMFGHSSLVAFLQGRGIDVNSQDKQLRTALHLAVISDKKEVLETLLDCKADIELTDDEGFTALMMACWQGRAEPLQILLKRGARFDCVDKYQRAPIHLAVLRRDEKVLTTLIDAGAPLDLFNGSGMAPLHVAASKGYETMLEILLARGATIETRDKKEQNTALHFAASSANPKPKVLDQLIQYKELATATNVQGRTPLHVAVDSENIIAVRRLLHCCPLEQTDNDGETVLITASRKGLEEIVAHLASAGANMNARDRSGNTPLHHALINGHHSVAKHLCTSGASVTIANNANLPPLHYAPLSLQPELADLIIRPNP